MEQTTKRSNFMMIAAIISFVMAFAALIQFGSYASWAFEYFTGSTAISTLLYLAEIAGYAIIGVGLLNASKKKLAVIGVSIIVGVNVVEFIAGFFWKTYTIHRYDYSYYSSYSDDTFNVLCIIPELLTLLFILLVFVMVAMDSVEQLGKYKETIKKLWFVPAIVPVVIVILALIINSLVDNVFIDYSDSGYWNGYWTYLSPGAIIKYLLFAVFVLMLGLDMRAPAVPVTQTAGGAVQEYDPNAAVQTKVNPHATSAAPAVEGYHDMVKHVLLLIFTFGVWYCIWIYKTTEYLNRVPGEQRRDPVAQLLLSLFVPFYLIYWVYKTSQIIDKYARMKGVESDITILCLLLAIFVGILPPIFMQDKLNHIVEASGGATVYTAPQAAPQQTPVYTASQAAPQQTPVYTAPQAAPQQAPVYTAPQAAPQQAPVYTAPQAAPAAPVEPAPVAPAVEPQAAPAAPAEPAPQAAPVDWLQAATELKAMKELLDAGVISQEEFDAKKKQLLGL